MPNNSVKEKEARTTLLDFFRTQINTQVQTITALVIALFSQGIGISFILDKGLQLPIFILGGAFFSSLAFLQWWKMFWYARLWNSTLVASPKSFQDIFKDKLNVEKEKYVEENEVAQLYLGVNELFISHYFQNSEGEMMNRWYALAIFLSCQTRHELIFSGLISCSVGFFPWIDWPAIPFVVRVIIFVIAIALLMIFLAWVGLKNCCSIPQIKQWLRSQDLKQLIGREYKNCVSPTH